MTRTDRPAEAQGYPLEEDGASDNDYDLLPYVSMPFAYSQPARLAAMGALHGLDAPNADRARVLELGCASGGNLVPLAARFPHARFLGLDLSRQHVDHGRRRIAGLGLSNIEIRQADIADAGLAGETFDYVLCHGVFSWVPRVVQEAIFAICNRHLSAEGMAVISYNVLPGWHLRNVVRGICLPHAGTGGAPQERVARARAILNDVAKTTDPALPYGHVVRSEAARLAKRPASYILGEFLAPCNDPCTFGAFAGRAAAFGLAYLCEADLPSSAPESSAPQAAAQIRAYAGTSDRLLQEYTDVFSGRTFRRSILVRAERTPLLAQPAQSHLAGLHFAAALQADALRKTERGSAFIDPAGRRFVVSDPAMGRAVARLAARFPATATLQELADSQPDGTLCDGPQAAKAVFKLLTTGRASVASLPLHCGVASATRPCLWPLARREIATGQPWVTSQRHLSVLLTPTLRLLLPLMDGTRDRAVLAKHLSNAVRSGTFKITTEGDPSMAHDDPHLDEVCTSTVVRAIEHAARNALLASEEPASQ